MYSTAVLSSYLYVRRSDIPDLDKMRLEFTEYRKFSKDPVVLYNDAVPGWFGLPLYAYRDLGAVADKVIDKRSIGSDIRIDFTSSYRDGQDEMVGQFRKYVAAGKTGFILQAHPGFGKTVVVASLLSILGKTTLVVVPRSNLVSQWIDRLCQHTTLKHSDIGTAVSGKADWLGKKVVIGLVHTLALDRFGEKFKRYFGVVAYDEVDRSVPPKTFAPVIGMFPSKYRIGVSATMKRQDGMEVVFEKHVGQVKIKAVDVHRMATKVLIHCFPGSSGPIFGKTAINRRGQLISRLAANDNRNALIARYAKSILVSGRRLVILSDRIKQLMTLKTILVANGWAAEKDIGFYVRRMPLPKDSSKDPQRHRETSLSERDRVANVCKVILATYGMFALGTDIAELAGLIYATPMSETEQSKGRIEREFSGKLQPVVVDIVDLYYKETIGWGKKRERQYVSEGLSVKKIRS